MSNTKRESINIVLDNIRVVGNVHHLDTYLKLSEHTSIPVSTIKSWYSKKNSYPKLSTLDHFCDAFLIHTSQLFVESNKFENKWEFPNDSMACFRYNLDRICFDKAIPRPKDRIKLLFDDDGGVNRYYSYLRENNGNSIPIPELDEIARKLKVDTYDLLKPRKEK